MLAIHIAAEINQRWDELQHLSSIDRLHVLETLVERHILATGPCCSSNYVPSYDDHTSFHSHRADDELDSR